MNSSWIPGEISEEISCGTAEVFLKGSLEESLEEIDMNEDQMIVEGTSFSNVIPILKFNNEKGE